MSEHLQGRILAVDDHEMWRAILGRQLEQANVDHELAKDADQAVNLLEPNAFTGVITDGLGGAWSLVYSAATIAQTRIVVLSSSTSILESARVIGVDAYDKNGIELSTFGHIIRSLVEPQ